MTKVSFYDKAANVHMSRKLNIYILDRATIFNMHCPGLWYNLHSAFYPLCWPRIKFSIELVLSPYASSDSLLCNDWQISNKVLSKLLSLRALLSSSPSRLPQLHLLFHVWVNRCYFCCHICLLFSGQGSCCCCCFTCLERLGGVLSWQWGFPQIYMEGREVPEKSYTAKCNVF